MSLSLRGLFIALPIVALVIGAMAWSIYVGSIDDDRANALRELDIANAAAADTLRREISLIAETEEKAVATMARKLEQRSPTTLGDIFAPATDGAFHSRDDLWEGRASAGAIQLRGIGGFLAPPQPDDDRRAAILAAFDTLRQMSNGLPSDVESLYFFSPANDLLIYAPQRPDELSFYRTAPADFDFQEAEFSRITSPAENPAGMLRCTSLQRPLYDETGDNWTTGCMLPIRVDDRHVGAWGISIPLDQFTKRLTPPPEDAFTIIVSRDGKLIHHSGVAGDDSRRLEANVDLATSEEPLLRAIWDYVNAGIDDQTVFAQPLDAYVSARELQAPDWYVLTVLPEQALSARAWSLAQRVILIALTGALALGLVLSAIFHRTVASRIARLATRIDRVSATEGVALDAGTRDEIRQLEHAFEKMEDRLATARSREQHSFDVLVNAAARYAMVLFDDQGQLIRASKGALDLFGEKELVKLPSEWGLSAESAPPTGHPAGPGPQPRIIARKLADGREVWLEEILISLEDHLGAPFGTAYIGHDITEKHTAQRAIEENLLYLELAQSSAQAGHFALDPHTMELSLSGWLREKLGVETPTIPLAELAALIDESKREETMAEIAAAIEARTEFSVETLAIGAEGDRLPIVVRGTAVFQDADNTEELAGFYGIAQDITEQKKAAEALLRARDEARAEARSKTDILAVISHEIRTPISGILGLIDQIRRERSESERSRALTLVEDSSEALLKTLDATLQRTRSEREQSVSRDEEFNPAALVERVAELFRPLARRKGLAIDVLAGSEGRACGQPARIQQVLANFVSNAIKFTPIGKVTLSFSAPEPGSDLWTFCVEDTGGGIDPERMKTIFEPFSGSAPDTLGRFSGSGLGLSITRDLAQQMGGTVAAESSASGGTRMTLTLPLQTAGPEEEQAPARGTIAIRLARASLAVRVEVIAHAEGFTVIDSASDDAGATVNIVVSDDAEFIAQSGAEWSIQLAEAAESARDGKHIVASEADLLDMLPRILDEVADG
jgi:signal transduction histidine kinase